MKRKFNLNDTVFFCNGEFGVKECRVYDVSISETSGNATYQIKWSPSGIASVSEHQIFSNAVDAEKNSGVK